MKYLRCFNLVLLCLLTSCKTPVATHTSGIAVELGVSLPTEAGVKLEIANYVSGSRLKLYEPLTGKYVTKHSTTNSYFYGLIKIAEESEQTLELKDLKK